MDKRKLLTKKPVVKATFNEKNESFDLEFGKNIDTEDVFVSVVFLLEAMAEKLELPLESVWNQLEVYHKARKQK